jgi:protein SCO1/2
MTTSIPLLLSLFPVSSAVAAAGDSRPPPFFDSAELTPYWPSEAGSYRPATVGSFQVVDQDGKIVTEKTMENGVSLVNFFFADCPGLCPMMMKNLERFRKRIGPLSKRVGIYSFSVRPESDPPEKLRKYAEERGIDSATWKLLTGDRSTIYSIGKGTFKADGSVGSRKSPNGFIHTKNVYLVDRKLRIRGVYDTSSVEEMNGLESDLDRLLGPGGGS